jgi:hypothetical protein
VHDPGHDRPNRTPRRPRNLDHDLRGGHRRPRGGAERGNEIPDCQAGERRTRYAALEVCRGARYADRESSAAAGLDREAVAAGRGLGDAGRCGDDPASKPITPTPRKPPLTGRMPTGCRMTMRP